MGIARGVPTALSERSTFPAAAPLDTVAPAVPPALKRGKLMRMLLLVILILLLIGAFPVWPYSSAWGYYPSGGLGVLLIILIVLIFAGVV
jgi:hypothetical protein